MSHARNTGRSLTSPDAAALLGISETTLAQWRHNGIGPHYHVMPSKRLLGRGIIVYHEADVVAYRDRHKTTAGATPRPQGWPWDKWRNEELPARHPLSACYDSPEHFSLCIAVRDALATHPEWIGELLKCAAAGLDAAARSRSDSPSAGSDRKPEGREPDAP